MISGFTESVAIVRGLRVIARQWCDLAGWNEGPETELDPALIAAWGLPASVQGAQIYCSPPTGVSGGLRLVELADCEQLDIRPNPQPWDCGGLLDLNVRVSDMSRRREQFRQAGWRGPSNPVEWMFGDKLVSEWLSLGPDGLAFALIERLDPPLPTSDRPEQIGAIFNSSQVVADMDASLEFYQQVLGFTCFLHIRQPLLEKPGENPLGIPHNLVSELETEIAILSPGGDMDGSVELIRMHGLEGRNFSARSRPPNLGLLGLRFPVADIDALARNLAGRSLCYDTIEVELLPLGSCRMLGVQAPEGAWLEFYQRL
jgi:catechol 2,3-dioxygenase-like lactoylglutathione lyase family enzyme